MAESLMGQWCVEPGDEENVKCYAEMVMNASMYVRIVMWRMSGGMCLAQSTAQSNRQSQYNNQQQGTPNPLGMPEWEEYDLYWYPYLGWMDFRGLASCTHAYLGRLGDWLRPRCPQHLQPRLQGRMNTDDLRACLTSCLLYTSPSPRD